MDWNGDFPLSLWGVTIAVLTVIVVHEAGHMFMAKLLGIPIKLITIGLGPSIWEGQLSGGTQLVLRPIPVSVAVGVTWRWDDEGRLQRSPVRDMLIATGGPAANLILALVLIGLALFLPLHWQAQYWLFMAGALSFVAAAANLLPIPGLDGGHLVILGATCFGLRLSPQQETRLHRLGFRFTALACLLVLAILRLYS